MEISASRPQVSIYDSKTGKSISQTKLPEVFLAPIRSDVVHFVHTNMAKNKRQPYGVMSQHGPKGRSAGHQNSAHSWGTGRAVSRVPRVSGSGTSRSGQGAVANMCRGGHRFAPTKVWRKWHRRINKNQKRLAAASALAASALPSLVSARGHRIDSVPEIPLVIDTGCAQPKKTKEAVALLKSVGAHDDIERVIKSRRMRAGKGKMRNRRFRQRRGPLVVYEHDDGIVRAFRNIPGVELCSVHSLNLLQLAPGAHAGRFIIWTKNAFQALDSIFGTFSERSLVKSKFVLPNFSILNNTDLNRIINSEEIQSVLIPIKKDNGRKKLVKKNLLLPENREELLKINPFADQEESNCSLEVVKDENEMVDE